jgi:hypothetical protein
MELLDRYIAAVKNCLPAAQRDDIGAEIAADIQAQIDERQETLGRPLTTDEAAEIIKAYGHPRLVASRYGSNETLIGPRLMPFYWYTLRIVLFLAVAAQVVFQAVREFAVGKGDVIGYLALLWGSIWGTFFFGVGVVTVIFAVLQRTNANVTRWEPRNLPRPEQPSDIKRWSVAIDLVANVCAFAVILDAFGVRRAILSSLANASSGAAAHTFELAPVLQHYVTPLLAVVVAAIVIDVVNLLRPDWSRLRAVVRIVMHVAMSWMALALLVARQLVLLAPEAAHTKGLIDAATALNDVVLACLVVFPFIAAYEVYRDVQRYRGVSRPAAFAAPANGAA